MKNFILIESVEQLLPYIKILENAKLIAVDTETTGLDPHGDHLRLIQLAVPELPVLLLDCQSFLPLGLDILRTIFATSAVKIFQNAKFDLQFLLSIGIELPSPIFDTMLAAQLLRTSGGPHRSGLTVLAQHYLGISLSKKEQISDWTGILRTEQLEYAALDASILLQLRSALIPFLQKNNLIEVARLEFSCVRAIARMEFDGIYLDLAKWSTLTKAYETLKEAALEALYGYTGRPMVQLSLLDEGVTLSENFDSNKVILALLHKNGIFVESTSHYSLASYGNHPLVQCLMNYRKASKALSTFLHTLPQQINPVTGRLHPHYGQIGAWSGRMSCGGPNIQQIPRDSAFRSCFAAPIGHRLIVADYSQIELRVAAEITKDPRMTQAYIHGKDLHKLTASFISGKSFDEITKKQRQAAKAVNFGLIFSMGAKGLQTYAQDTYGVHMTLEEASTFRKQFFQAYGGVAAWHHRLQQNPPRETRTLAYRKHTFTENAGLAGLTNTPVQGSAADILKQALGMLVDPLGKYHTKIVAVVHDEIILEAPREFAIEVAALLKSTMEQAGARYLKSLPTIADVSIATSWAEK